MEILDLITLGRPLRGRPNAILPIGHAGLTDR
jgi:hypothetical protein